MRLILYHGYIIYNLYLSLYYEFFTSVGVESSPGASMFYFSKTSSLHIGGILCLRAEKFGIYLAFYLL